MQSAVTPPAPEGIAIIGMAARFPGARNVQQFWQNLRDGVESISFFSGEELIAAGVDPSLVNSPDYVKAWGVLQDAEWFDASFFGFTARETRILDPQQRVFLECAWEALENAGHDSETYQGSIGVYAGVGRSTYLLNNLVSSPETRDLVHDITVGMGTDKDYVPTRTSYKMNIRGPSVSVQTACSTSLVAVHLACQSLLNGECDMALAGAATIRVPQIAGYTYQDGGILAPDGHCRAFDAGAHGTVGGNGAGVVVLKRLANAIADGDCIYAVIKGSAINNDGATKIGYTAPSIDGQAAVIAEALAVAGVDPGTISYVETHGTGTSLGDPIEVEGLTRAFRAKTGKKQFCAIGSVKTNIGHLDTAAGIAGLIKTVCALRHQLVPPSLNFVEPNPRIDFANGPFYVNTKLTEWRQGQTPRRAGVSSFGIGGTNVHLIVEEAPPVEASGSSRPWHLLALSAKTGTALKAATTNLLDHLKAHPDAQLADVAYTLQTGRRAFAHRSVLVCRDHQHAVRALEAQEPLRTAGCPQDSGDRPVAFLFPGQGAQYVDMGRQLYQAEPVFRDLVDRCADILKPHLGRDLREVLYPSVGADRDPPLQGGGDTTLLDQTVFTQPALFVIEYALARLWMEWGVRPQAMMGHSIGEYVAACLSGVFSLEEALALVAHRGRLVQQLPGGAMLSVSLPEAQVKPWLGKHLSVAAVNGPSRCVVSGRREEVAQLETRLAAEGVECRSLHTSHAFHSEMMDPVVAELEEHVRRITLSPPRLPFVSNLTGTWITDAEATDPTYWARHLRNTVRFSDGVSELAKRPDLVLLEVGPGRTLSSLVRENPHRNPGHELVTSMRHPRDSRPDTAVLLEALGQLWLSGVPVDWPKFNSRERRRRLPLPTYPFERQRYLVEPGKPGAGSNGHQAGELGKKPDLADWFYVPSWKRSPLVSEPASVPEEKHWWLVFTDNCGLGNGIITRLKDMGRQVVAVAAGERFMQLGDRQYTVNPRKAEDYKALFQSLHRQQQTPGTIAHLWGVGPVPDARPEVERLQATQDLGFYSLLFLAQALGQHHLPVPLHIAVVTSNVQEVSGDEPLCPEKATVLGCCRGIPLEYPNIACRSVDVVVPSSGAWEEVGARHASPLPDQLIAELASRPPEVTVAYRGPHRWVQITEPVRLKAREGPPRRLRERGVYLITGGLGGIGLEVAEHLAKTVHARLILTGRSGLPPKERWAGWLAVHDPQDTASQRIRKIQALEALGAEVQVAQADVANHQQMKAVFRQIEDRFGALHGVIHAAGIGAGGYEDTIQTKTVERAASVFAPKMKGTQVLAELCAGKDLDFLVLFSSLASIAPYLGQVDYCGANVYLDSYAHYSSSRGGPFTVTINWDNWQEVGMAANAVLPDALKKQHEANLEFGIRSSEGLEAFNRILSSTLPHVLVSTQDLQPRIGRALSQLPSPEPVGASNGHHRGDPATHHPRPMLGNEYVAPRNTVEQVLSGIWGACLGFERVGINDNFFDLGGDSVLSIMIIGRANQAGLKFSIKQMFEHPTIAGLATVVDMSQAAADEHGQATGPVPLTPIQHWFFQRDLADPHHFNLPVSLEVQQPLDPALLEKALHQLVLHHDALRFRYVRGDSEWQQTNAGNGELAPIRLVDLSQTPEAEQTAAMERTATELQGSLNLAEGPLVRAALFDLGAHKPSHLLIVVHHLVVDVFSWRILLEDLEIAYRQLSRGEAVQLQSKTTTFMRWAERLKEFAHTEAVQGEMDYWLAPFRTPVSALPRDYPKGANTESAVRTVSVFLSAAETRALLQEVHKAYNTQINDVLLTALSRALVRWTGGRSHLVSLEGHGRDEVLEGVNLSRTVGWFTTLFPVLLEAGADADLGAALRATKEELRRLPGRGLGYGLLRYLRGNPAIAQKLAAMPQPETAFGYLGQFDQVLPGSSPFKLVQETTGPLMPVASGAWHSPRGRRSHLLEIAAMVADGQLRADWMYSQEVHRRDTIERLAQSFVESLRSLIRHCQSPEAGAYTPSDFPGAHLSQEALNKLIARLGQPDRSRS